MSLATASAHHEPAASLGLDVAVVVPVFNEGAVLRNVLVDVMKVFPHVVCVDDGSGDMSASIAKECGALVVRHPSNLGQGAALQTGITFALECWPSVKYIMTFDSDGQHRVEDALRMVTTARTSGTGVVMGSRFLQPSHAIPLRRRVILRTGVWYTRLTTRLTLTDTHCGLRVLRRDVAEAIEIRLSGMAHASEILDFIARRQIPYVEISVDVRYSDYSLKKGQRALNAVNIVFDLAVGKLRTVR